MARRSWPDFRRSSTSLSTLARTPSGWLSSLPGFGLLRRAEAEFCAIFVLDASRLPRLYSGQAGFYAYDDLAQTAIALAGMGGILGDTQIVATRLP